MMPPFERRGFTPFPSRESPDLNGRVFGGVAFASDIELQVNGWLFMSNRLCGVWEDGVASQVQSVLISS